MKTGMHQSTQLRQELKINPRLYQAMDLLYMPLLDLQQHLKQELLNNPFLEMVEPEEEEEDTTTETETETKPEEEQGADDIDWEEILLNGFDSGGHAEEHEEKEYFERVTVDTRDLGDYLREQIALLDLSPRQVALAEEFIGNVNEDGYLSCSLDEIRNGINEFVGREAEERGIAEMDGLLYSAEEMEAMLRIIQNLDPPGVGARDLRMPAAAVARSRARAVRAIPAGE